jgi:hypothetical protein
MNGFELIEELKKHDLKREIVFFEKGGCYDSVVSKVGVSNYDKKNNINRITLGN